VNPLECVSIVRRVVRSAPIGRVRVQQLSAAEQR